MRVIRDRRAWGSQGCGGVRCCLVLVTLFVFFTLGLGWLLRSTDLGAQPPSTSFKQVFGIPPPPGVADLHVAGIANLSGEVWMRFNASNVDAVVEALKANPNKPLAGPDSKYEGVWLPPTGDSHPFVYAVGWHAIVRVRHPEYYSFPKQFGGSGWAGVVVLDRAQYVLRPGSAILNPPPSPLRPQDSHCSLMFSSGLQRSWV